MPLHCEKQVDSMVKVFILCYLSVHRVGEQYIIAICMISMLWKDEIIK